MRDYVLGKAVDLDLDTIWDYIAQDNILAADRDIPTFLSTRIS
jgi:hypothetical protein